MNNVSRDQIQEWAENPVTLALRDAAEDELQRIVQSPLSDNLCRGKPQLTQENLVENTAKELEWETFIEILDGDWSQLEGEEDEDGDLP